MNERTPSAEMNRRLFKLSPLDKETADRCSSTTDVEISVASSASRAETSNYLWYCIIKNTSFRYSKPIEDCLRYRTTIEKFHFYMKFLHVLFRYLNTWSIYILFDVSSLLCRDLPYLFSSDKYWILSTMEYLSNSILRSARVLTHVPFKEMLPVPVAQDAFGCCNGTLC